MLEVARSLLQGSCLQSSLLFIIIIIITIIIIILIVIEEPVARFLSSSSSSSLPSPPYHHFNASGKSPTCIIMEGIVAISICNRVVKALARFIIVKFPDPLAIGSGLGNLTRFIIIDHPHHHLQPFMMMITNMMIILCSGCWWMRERWK